MEDREVEKLLWVSMSLYYASRVYVELIAGQPYANRLISKLCTSMCTCVVYTHSCSLYIYNYDDGSGRAGWISERQFFSFMFGFVAICVRTVNAVMYHAVLDGVCACVRFCFASSLS